MAPRSSGFSSGARSRHAARDFTDTWRDFLGVTSGRSSEATLIWRQWSVHTSDLGNLPIVAGSDSLGWIENSPEREQKPAVIHELRDRIASITLNRPDARNAIDEAMDSLLWHSFARFRDDDEVYVAIVTGAGEAFCAGADLKTLMPARMNQSAWWVRQNAARGLGGITRGLHDIRKPLIAAVNGWALAAGFELALACDIRIASEQAHLGSFEARRGFHHMDGGIARLVDIAGVGAALELVLTAEPIGGGRAP